MNPIIQNMTDPSWWFTGLFFVVIAYLFPKIIQLFARIPVHFVGLKRRAKLKSLKRIKSIRFDDAKVIVEGVKASTWQVVFVLSAFLFTYRYFATEYFNLLSFASSIGHAIPVYVVEVVYLLQRRFYRKLLLARDKIRIARLSKPFKSE